MERALQPKQFLALVQWYVQLAMLMRRVPVLPEMPCELTKMEWPSHCPQDPSQPLPAHKRFVNANRPPTPQPYRTACF